MEQSEPTSISWKKHYASALRNGYLLYISLVMYIFVCLKVVYPDLNRGLMFTRI